MAQACAGVFRPLITVGIVLLLCPSGAGGHGAPARRGSTPHDLPVGAPAFWSAPGTTFSIGRTNTFTVGTTGSPTARISTAGALPAGVTFADNGDGTAALSGTPDAGTAGTYPLTLTATNADGSATQDFVLTVQEPLAITSASATTFTVGVLGSFTVTHNGSGSIMFMAMGLLPQGVSLNATTGVLRGTPEPGTAGTYPVLLKARPMLGGPEATQNFTLTVVDGYSITSAAAATFTTGTFGSFTVTTDMPTPTFAVTGTLPDGVGFDTSTGVLSGTPGAATGGVYPLTVSASSASGASASKAFTLTVNQPAVITSAAAATFRVGVDGSFQFTATGFPAPTFSVDPGTPLPNGLSYDHASHSVVGTPAHASGGTYTLTVRAANYVGDAAVQTFTLTVQQAPYITSASSATFWARSPGAFTVVWGGYPRPTLSVEGALPSGVEFLPDTGVLTGTPGAGSGAAYPLTITAANGVGTNATQSFTLTVNEPAGFSGPTSTTFTAGQPGTFTVQRVGYPVPTLSISGSLPAGVLFDTDAGVLGGTPAVGSGGTYPLTFTASNGLGDPATRAFTLTVAEGVAFTSAASATFRVGQAAGFTVRAVGVPAPAITLDGTLPAGVIFNPVTHVIGGTPLAGSGGAYALRLTADNAVDPPVTQNFTLVVTEPPAFTCGWYMTFAVGQAGRFVFTASGYPAPTFGVIGDLPLGLHLNADTGVLSGTPGQDSAGLYHISFRATNGIGDPAVLSVGLRVIALGWQTSSDMQEARADHTMTRLRDGSLLAAGGISNLGNRAVSETFDPVTGYWNPSGTLNTPRKRHTATLLPNGQVLVAGGDQYGAVASAELYTPSSRLWSETSAMGQARANHAAAPLPDGRVLVAGGSDAHSGTYVHLTSAEAYDPSTARWNALAALRTGREYHTATLLKTGQVLVVGGVTSDGAGGGNTLASAELYDPAEDRWTATGSLRIGRYAHTATLLPNGQVLVTGGESGAGIQITAELYDPRTGTWTLTAPMHHPRKEHAATLLANGLVMVTGGRSENLVFEKSAELYAFQSGGWSETPDLVYTRARHTSTLMADGHLMICGGRENLFYRDQCERYHPGSGPWFAMTTLTVSPQTLLTGQPTTAQVVVDVGELGAPTGTVTFKDNGVDIPTCREIPVTAGAIEACTFTPAAGTHAITAIYSGDARFSSQTAGPATVTTNAAPAITSPAGFTVRVLAHQLFTVTTTGFPVPTISVAGTLPSGVTITDRGNGTAELDAIAAAGTDGRYLLTITATNGVGQPATQAFTLLVDASTWLEGTALPEVRVSHTATLHPSGQVLIVGGNLNGGAGPSDRELNYLISSGEWLPLDGLHTKRVAHSTTLLPDGRVLVVGGFAGGTLVTTAEIYGPGPAWTEVPGPAVARSGHTATLLPDGRVLVVGGPVATSQVVEIFDPAHDTWATVAPLHVARLGHTTTLLPDGRVLVAGGVMGVDSLSSAEIYDPVQDTWTTTPPMTVARSGHTATLLSTGQVLVAGGTGTDAGDSSEIFSPSFNSWRPASGLVSQACRHTATLLPDGRVLLLGGDGTAGPLGADATAQLFDPISHIWSLAPPLVTARRYHSSTLLPDGRVLVVGGTGRDGLPVTGIELYDLGESVRRVGSDAMGNPRWGHSSTLLRSGDVLVAGGTGSDGAALGSVLRFARATSTWASAANMGTPRGRHTATRLFNGQVLVVGGVDTNGALASAEIYDPATDTWGPTGSLHVPRMAHTATLLPDGQVLVAGGYVDTAGTATTSAELYDPRSGVWSETGSLAEARAEHTATRFVSGIVLVTGGRGATTLASSEMYVPTERRWGAVGALSTARAGHSATLLPNYRVLVLGGTDATGRSVPTAESYDVSSYRWSPVTPPPVPLRDHAAVLLPTGQLLVVGGAAPVGGESASVRRYDPTSDRWLSAGDLVVARARHTATLLDDGRVLVAGGSSEGLPLGNAELIDPRRSTLMGAGYPTLTPLADTVGPGAALVLSGTGFRGFGFTEATGGGLNASPTNIPLAQIRWLEGDLQQWLPLTGGSFGATTFPTSPNPMGPRGPAAVTVFVNGIASASVQTLISDTIPTRTSVRMSVNTVIQGQVATAFASVATDQPAQVGGLMAFRLDGAVIAGCEAVSYTSANGAHCDVTPAIGAHVVTASYSGYNSYAPSNSPGAALTAQEPPQLSGSKGMQCRVGIRETRTVSASGYPRPALAVTGTMPAGAEFRDEGNGVGTFDVTARSGSEGRYVVTVTASNGVGVPATMVFVITVDGSHWTAVNPMPTGRAQHTASLLPGGRVLVAGGAGVGAIEPHAELEFDPLTGRWIEVMGLLGPRQSHTATVLADGRVLVAGGSPTVGDVLATAEIYDPKTSRWTATGPLHEGRGLHTATRLTNGQVLVVGGTDDRADRAKATAELFDPGTGTWSLTGSMAEGRRGHTATLLPDGRVLVAGGTGASGLALTSVEIYEPSTGFWHDAGVLRQARSGHTATLLPDGNVLIVGGGRQSAEVHSTAVLGASRETPALPSAATQHVAVLLPDGRVMIAGGYAGGAAMNPASAVQIYDPVADTWTLLAPLTWTRYAHTATLLADGRVFVTGGYGDDGKRAEAELLDLSGVGRLRSMGTLALTTARRYHTSTMLPDGHVLVVGGESGPAAAPAYYGTTERFLTPANASVLGPALGTPRSRHTATLLANGQVLVVGGMNASGYLAGAELYDPALNRWYAARSLHTARARHTATLLGNGRVLVTGGRDANGPVSMCEIYDPTTGYWTECTGQPTQRYDHTATLLPNGLVLVAGGVGPAGAVVATAFLFQADGTPISTSLMGATRAGHTATLLGDGSVLIVGGRTDSGPVWSAERYVPTTDEWHAAGTMAFQRTGHTATLLADGNVLVAGGIGAGGAQPAGLEEFSLPTVEWRRMTSLVQARDGHTATLLTDGTVLLIGGQYDAQTLTSVERFDHGDTIDPAQRPQVHDWPSRSRAVAGVVLNGSGFLGHRNADGSGGTTGSSPTNFPLVQLRRLDNGQVVWAQPYAATPTSYFSQGLPGIHVGPWMVRVIVNGVSSEAGIVRLVEAYPTNTSVSFSSNPILYPGSVTIEATISDPIVPIPTSLSGEMRFLDNGAGLAGCFPRPVAGSSATCTWNFAPGSHSITAIYSGDTQSGLYEGSVSAPVELVVQQAPWVSSAPGTMVRIGVPHAFTVTAGGYPAPALTAANLPAGVTFTDLGQGTGRLDIVAPAGSAGRHTIQLTASNGVVAPAVQSFVLTVDSGAWHASSSFVDPRAHHTVTVLPNGRALVAGGRGDRGTFASAYVYDIAEGYWAMTGSMREARSLHTATLLLDGRVLVAGGTTVLEPIASAEIYDPATGQFTSVAPMNDARAVHTATLLLDGRVLVVGGGPATAELFDPATGQWTRTGSPALSTWRHTATLLPDGTVLMAGGTASGQTARTEIYDPATERWHDGAPMRNPRESHSATLLATGAVLVAGGTGVGGTPTPSAELYSPTGEYWRDTGSMGAARYQHTATLLPGGEVVLIGGFASTSATVAEVEIYDPSTGLFNLTDPLEAGPAGHATTLLPGGQVFVTGGLLLGVPITYRGQSMRYDPAYSEWHPVADMPAGRHGHTGTRLPDGNLLVVGGVGVDGHPLSSALRYGVTWVDAGTMRLGRTQHTATLLPDGTVLVVGGLTGDPMVATASVEVFDPATGRWSRRASMRTARASHTATLLPDGQVLVAGGRTGTPLAETAAAEVYDPRRGTWTAVPDLAAARMLHTATLLTTGRVLIAGGSAGGSALTSAEIFDPATSSWQPTGSMGAARVGHRATLVGGAVLVTGGNDAAPLASAEFWRDTGHWMPTTAMQTARTRHTSTLLDDGSVLVVGGMGAAGWVSTGERFDPVSREWHEVPLNFPSDDHSATLMADGAVLLVGGSRSPVPTAAAGRFLFGNAYGLVGGPLVATAARPLVPGSVLDLAGQGFRGAGLTEGSGGTGGTSATNTPVLRLRRLDNDRITWLAPASATAANFRSHTVPTLDVGPTAATLMVNGRPSNATTLYVAALVPSRTILSVPTGPVVEGVPVDLYATVVPIASGTATGQVLFQGPSGWLSCGAQTLDASGHAACRVPFTAGIHEVWAVYQGDAAFGGSVSAILEVDARTAQAPAWTTASAGALTVGVNGQFHVAATGFPVPTLTVTGTLPGGVPFEDHHDGTGAFTGTPASGTGGAYVLTLGAENGVGAAATQAFTLTIRQEAVFTSAAAATFHVGSLGSFLVTSTGFPVPTVSHTGALPSGLQFYPGLDGTDWLTGTPAPGSEGTYALTLTADNHVGPPAIQSFTLTIRDARPALTALVPSRVDVGSGAFTLRVTGTGFLSGAAAYWNGEQRTTRFVSDTAVDVSILARDVDASGTGAITAKNPAPNDGASNALTFTIMPVTPTVLSLSPGRGPVGSSVTVAGRGFEGVTRVTFNGLAATYDVVSSTSITATVPAEATTGPVVVTAAGGAATSPAPFTVTPPCSFTIDSAAAGARTAGGTGSVAVTASEASCTWAATSHAAWITDVTPEGTGSGTVTYTVAPNQSTTGRVGTITIAGETFTVAQAPTGQTTRVSVGMNGEAPNGASTAPSMSADGRYVAFASTASNLVPNDTNDCEDVFVFDRVSGATTRVSVAGDGTQGNGPSGAPVISADGQVVAFVSSASNLVAGDTNGARDVFVVQRGRAAGATTRVSVSSTGAQGNGANVTAYLNRPAISADGRFIAFASDSTNLVDGDANAAFDVFVHDRLDATTTRVSVATDGTEGDGYAPAISADGRYVAFMAIRSFAADDTNGAPDVYVRDRTAGTTTLASIPTAGGAARGGFFPAISSDGGFVAFGSLSNELVAGDSNAGVDVFLRDLRAAGTTRVSEATGGVQGSGGAAPAWTESVPPALGLDGRYVALASTFTNLAGVDGNGAVDTFVRDRQAGVTTRASLATDGTEGNGGSGRPALSHGGRSVAFESVAGNLVDGDTNGVSDVFVRDLVVPATVTGISPPSGSTVDTTAVTISGTHFDAGAVASIGGTPLVDVAVVDSTTITATVPAGHAAGVFDVTVINPGVAPVSLAGAFTFWVPATVTAITPSVGSTASSTAVTINGTRFVAGATAAVGGTALAAVAVVNATTLTGTVPAGHAPGVADVVVTNPGRPPVTLLGAFTFRMPATVTGIAPTSGSTSGPTSVTITGTHFVAGAAVAIGGTNLINVEVVDGTTITATVPAGHAAGVVDVVMTNPGMAAVTLADAFTFWEPATVTGITPTSGWTGGTTAVTVSGTQFAAGATVAIGGTALAGVAVLSSTTITGTVPAGHAVGVFDVVVTNPGRPPATLVGAFTVSRRTPEITWADPAPITVGTPLSAIQLNATMSVPGPCVYSPAAGTVLAVGTHTLSVTCTPTDSANYTSATKIVSIAVVGAPFTDPTLAAGTTPVRLVHVVELRTRIDALRVRYGLVAYGWTDPTLVAGQTPLKAVHIIEMRRALEAAYVAAGRTAPVYTDAVIVPGQTMMKVAHIAELRAAVVALE